MKHTSTVLKPTTPFHTLVEFVDADDKINDKIHTHDLIFEVNSIKNQLQTRNLDIQQSEQLMFTQPRDPNKKHEPAYKKYCSNCHKTKSLHVNMFQETRR